MKEGLYETEQERIMTKYSLTSQDIQIACDELRSRLADANIDKSNKLRICLSVEECLLLYQEKLGADVPFELSLIKRFGKLRAVLRIAAPATDPFTDISEEDLLLQNALSAVGISKAWQYRHGENLVTVDAPIKRKLSSVMLILGAALSGVLLGILARMLDPDFCSELAENYLLPVSDTIMGLLGTVAVFFILFSIMNGICSLGNTSTFQKIGKQMLVRFITISFLCAIVTISLAAPLFDFQIGANGNYDFSALWKMILDIVPSNITNVFFTGNSLQVVFIAIVLGAILLILEAKTKGLIDLVQQADQVMQYFIELIVKLMPVVVFINLFKLLATESWENLIKYAKFPVLMLVFSILCTVLFLLRTAITQKVSPVLLFKKLLPTFIIAFSTASSTAALSESIRICKKDLGIDDHFVNIGLPLSTTLFSTGTVFEVILFTLCAAEIYHVSLSVSQLVILLINSIILAMAVPKIPDGTVGAYVMLFAQLGIPTEAVTIIAILGVITDRFCTPAVVVSIQTEMIQQASKLKLIDIDVLRSKKTYGEQ